LSNRRLAVLRTQNTKNLRYLLRLKNGVLKKGSWGDVTSPELLKVNDWIVVIPFGILLSVVLWLIESAGLLTLYSP